MRWSACLFCALALGLSLCTDALAQPIGRVALVVPDEPDTLSARAEERLRAELTAAGYEVVTVPVDGTADRGLLRTVAKRTRSTAAVSLRRGSATFDGAVWAKDERSGREALEPVRSAEATLEGAAAFAIWAAEQLHASLLAFDTDRPSAEEAPTTEPPASVVAPPQQDAATDPGSAPPRRPVEPERPYAVSGGIAVLFGPGGVPAGAGPALSLEWHTGPWFGAFTFLGPVSSSLQAPSGSVDIDQEQALLRAGAEVDTGIDPLVPFAAVGLGAYRLGARGDAVAPYRSASNQAWSGLFQLVGGLRWQVSPLVRVTGEGGLWLAGARPVVRIEGAPNAHIGRPGYVGSLGVGLSW